MRNKTTSFIDKPPLPNEGGGGHQQGQLFRGEGFSTRGSAEWLPQFSRGRFTPSGHKARVAWGGSSLETIT